MKVIFNVMYSDGRSFFGQQPCNTERLVQALERACYLLGHSITAVSRPEYNAVEVTIPESDFSSFGSRSSDIETCARMSNSHGQMSVSLRRFKKMPEKLRGRSISLRNESIHKLENYVKSSDK